MRPATEPIDHSRLKIYHSLGMYRRPKFLEVLHEIREEMSREADYDIVSLMELIKGEPEKSEKTKIKKTESDEKDKLTGDRRPLTTSNGNRI